MRFLRTVAALVAVCMSLSCACAGILFGNPDLSNDDNVIFTLRNAEFPNAKYESLFSINLNSANYEHDVDLLTYYPEQMEMISEGKILQIRNRYGTVRFDVNKKSFSWLIQNWKTKADFFMAENYRLPFYSASPNGKWFCYVEKTGVVYGRIVIEESGSGKKIVICEKVLLTSVDYGKVPVVWASDSSALFYEKNGSIYFLSPEPFFRGIEAEEENRRIGDGQINSICAADRYVFYLNGDCVYRISTRELYTLGLYSDIIGTGTPVGRLADVFSPATDYFSVSPSTDSMIVVRGGKTVAVYSLPKNGSNFLPITCYRPYVNSDGSVVDFRVIWAHDGTLSVWFELMPYNGGKPFSVVNKISGQTITPVLNIANYAPPVVSPDRKRVLISSDETLSVYDTSNWNCVANLYDENIVSAVWATTDVVYAGGEYTLRKWQVSENVSEVVSLSSTSSARWNYNIVVANANNKQYLYNKNTHAWSVASSDLYIDSAVQNGRYRVYCGESANSKYENALYMRTLTGYPQTRAVFSESVNKNEIAKTKKKVSLVFDAYDSPDGLSKILSVLYKYGLRSTFFLNGEFIKRYPQETKQIARSKNECASMFFTVSDLTAGNFNMNESFVRRGLARTEDLFYQVTGSELSLLWHAPFYSATSAIITSARNAGYFYIEPTFFPLDYVTLEQATAGFVYESSTEMIKKIVDTLNTNKGGCVPIGIGILNGTRIDYLYNHIELLINAILDAGFEIVPASSLR